MDEDQQYDYLTEQYNTQVGVGTRVGDALKIKDIRSIEGLSTDKNATVGHLKAHLYRENAKYVEGSVQIVNSKFVSHHLGKYHPTKIAAYLRPKLEKEGHEVEDKIGFATGSLGDMLELRKSLVNKEGHKYLKKKETAEANK
jgi:hypothetical protein